MTAPTLSRRRFLTISAAAGAMMASPAAASTSVQTWKGQAMGAATSMKLVGVDEVQATRVFTAVEQELARLEAIFSLYDPNSQLSRLNAEGQLAAPAPELLEVLSLSGALNDSTGGVFNPAVQPLWQAHARAELDGRAATDAEIKAATALSAWQDVRFDTSAVRFERPGMALTFNGIAQGFITDRIAAQLRGFGLTDVLLDMGEIAAMGERPGGGAWRMGVVLPDGSMVERLELSDRALATSAPGSMTLNQRGKLAHILDPLGQIRPHRLVSISAPNAAVADGLSTAGCLLTPDRLESALAVFPGAKLEKRI